MSDSINRRHFLGVAASSTLGYGLSSSSAASAENKLIVGVMGTGGRGTGLAQEFAKQPGVEVAYVCDVDEKRVNHAAEAVNKVAGKAPKAVPDFRRILDDKDVNILVVATCNHWHAPAAIAACAAGKHVYVEKPCSHNPHEGELLVEAAQKNDRRVQMGNQRRSWPKVMEAIQEVRNGAIGRAYFAQAWYQNTRSSIGKGKETTPPAGLDYNLWQGPAPRRAFHDNYLHYNWHWFWHWGNGELGNNGIHMIDVCRWGLGADFPIHVTSSGGRYRFQDDQETPDTHIVTFDFADRKSITWEGFSCTQMGDGKVADVIFYGDNGTLAINGGNYTIYDPKGKEVRKASGSSSEALHFANFLDAVRNGGHLNSPIDEGHKSTLLCHLGNIAQRTGRALRCDPKNGRILEDSQAMAMWKRAYEPGWEPKV
jgi:predicted dehydrogenase